MAFKLLIIFGLVLVGFSCQHKSKVHESEVSQRITFTAKELICPQGLGFYRAVGDTLFIHNNERGKTYLFRISDNSLIDSIDLTFCNGFIIKIASYKGRIYALTDNSIYDVMEKKKVKYLVDSMTYFISDQVFEEGRYLGLSPYYFESTVDHRKRFAVLDLETFQIAYFPINEQVSRMPLANIETSITKTIQIENKSFALLYSYIDTIYLSDGMSITNKIKLEGSNYGVREDPSTMNEFVKFGQKTYSNAFVINDSSSKGLIIVRKFPLNQSGKRNQGKIFRYTESKGLEELGKCFAGFPIILKKQLYVVNGTRTGKIWLEYVCQV